MNTKIVFLNLLSFFILSFVGFFVLTPHVAAQTPLDLCPADGSGFGPLCAKNADGGLIGNIVKLVVTLLFIGAVIVALFFLIWGGIQWIISGGDKAKVESARNTIIAAIIGLVVVFLSYAVIGLVGTIFKIDLFRLTIPQISL